MAALDLYAQGRDGRLPRLSRLLGLPAETRTDLSLADRLSQGLPAQAVDHLVEVLGRAAVIGPVIPETSYRRALKSGRPLSRDLSDRLYNLGRIVDAAARMYHGDVEGVRHFLLGPHMLLEGRSALEVAAASNAGTEVVLSLIHAAEYGFPV
jgi:putative toxin-antitoxin system antitoxin component (TIGR02293 family)